MSDVLIVSCRFCLEPDELPSMVTIDRLLSNPPRTVTVTVCRPCARAIEAAIVNIDHDDAYQEREHDPASDLSDRGGDPPPASPEAGDSLVLPSDPGDSTAPVDRQEPEMPARRANRRAKD